MPAKKTPPARDAAPAKSSQPGKPVVKAAAKAKAPAGGKPTAVPAKVSAKAATSAKVGKAESPVTIVVRHDAGWGNHLHLRGEGPGLSWDAGSPLCCVHADEWVWVAPAPGEVTVKVLHNDSKWASGDNVVVKSGSTVTLRPVF